MIRSPVRKSLLRQITWFGGDRRLIGISVLILFLVGVTMFFGYGFFYGLSIGFPGVLFFVILWVAREAGKSDPFMVDVVRRQFKYKKYYPAKSDVDTEHPLVRDFK